MAPEPEPTVETVKDFWEGHVNNEYYTDAARASDEYFREIEERRYETHYHLAELFQSLAGSHGKLLEVGCGIGVDSVQLAKCGFDVTAVDLTENALQVARENAARAGVTIDFRLGNAEGLDFPDETFDAVYSFGVLHHTPDIEAAVAEVHRVLKPGGIAYVMLYARDSVVNAGPQDVPIAVRVTAGPQGPLPGRLHLQPLGSEGPVRGVLERGGPHGLPLHLRLRSADDQDAARDAQGARAGHRVAPDDRGAALTRPVG